MRSVFSLQLDGHSDIHVDFDADWLPRCDAVLLNCGHDDNSGSCAGQLSAAVGVIPLHGRVGGIGGSFPSLPFKHQVLSCSGILRISVYFTCDVQLVMDRVEMSSDIESRLLGVSSRCDFVVVPLQAPPCYFIPTSVAHISLW